jgi:hypothetical protein
LNTVDPITINPTAIVADLREQGYAIIPSVFATDEVKALRETVMRNLGLMARTRHISHSYHLAGFHRFDCLFSLHEAIASNERIQRFLHVYYDGQLFETFGLSDITVNRSQHWHTDLLRGKYSDFLADGSPWHEPGHSCIKALIYLQPGKSLRIVPGTHAAPSPLYDDELEILARNSTPTQPQVGPGDVVMMDIRALHRGATDAEMSNPQLERDPKILVSTVFGKIGSPFTLAMTRGNTERLADWDRRHLTRDR